MEANTLSKAEACAELVVRHLNKLGVVVHAERNGSVVKCWTQSNGVHLGNIQEDFVFNAHLICEAEGIKSPDDVPKKKVEDAPVYFNGTVEEIREDPKKITLPTHVHKRAGPEKRANIDEVEDATEEERRLCKIAGFDV